MPLWTNEMATPQTDTHTREQARRDEQAHKTGDAARAGIEKLADFRKGPEGIMVERSGGQSVHIVDDDEAMCDWLAALVEAAGLLAKTYASAVELLNSPGGLAADCFVADIRIPEMDGLQLQQELTRRGVSVPLIIITGHADVGLAVQAMKAGVSDFLEKPFEGERLLTSLRDALEQGCRQPRTNPAPNSAADRLVALTGREWEIVDRLVAGLSNKEIARELGISYRTVEVHRARIMDKTQARSFSQLVRLALGVDHPHSGTSNPVETLAPALVDGPLELALQL